MAVHGIPGTMSAWVVSGRTSTRGRLARVTLPVPEPGPGEVLVRVHACGVCRTDLHLADHDLAPRGEHRVPGHEVVGDIVALGPGARRLRLGERVGIAWLRQTCGSCDVCRSGSENLCRHAQFTGWDVDGGFAEYALAEESFAYHLPENFDDVTAAPLLCSGIIGFRALLRSRLRRGGRLGIYGFGASAHLTAQLALARGAEVHVLTRGESARRLATALGAASVGDAYGEPPVPLGAAILFAPVGDLVPVALRALDQGGTLVIAGIHLTDVPPLGYQDHLFREKTLTSVTANTRDDGIELLRQAAEVGLRPVVTTYAFDEADQALEDLASGRLTGAAVLVMPTAETSDR